MNKNFCLRIGTALVYTSIILLLEVIQNRLSSNIAPQSNNELIGIFIVSDYSLKYSEFLVAYLHCKRIWNYFSRRIPSHLGGFSEVSVFFALHHFYYACPVTSPSRILLTSVTILAKHRNIFIERTFWNGIEFNVNISFFWAIVFRYLSHAHLRVCKWLSIVCIQHYAVPCIFNWSNAYCQTLTLPLLFRWVWALPFKSCTWCTIICIDQQQVSLPSAVFPLAVISLRVITFLIWSLTYD